MVHLPYRLLLSAPSRVISGLAARYQAMVSSTHEQWRTLCTTSETSCDSALDWLFSTRKAGKTISGASYQAMARRLAIFENIRVGTYSRLGYKPATAEKMLSRVRRGQYDDDLDTIRQDLDEDVDAGACR